MGSNSAKAELAKPAEMPPGKKEKTSKKRGSSSAAWAGSPKKIMTCGLCLKPCVGTSDSEPRGKTNLHLRNHKKCNNVVTCLIRIMNPQRTAALKRPGTYPTPDPEKVKKAKVQKDLLKTMTAEQKAERLFAEVAKQEKSAGRGRRTREEA